MENLKTKLTREEMLPTIIYMFDDGSISTKKIVMKSGISSVMHIRKRYSLLMNTNYEDVCKLYQLALELVGERPTKEKMFEVVKTLFDRDLTEYEILKRTGVSSYYKYKSYQSSDRFRYENLYKLYKFELALREEES
ncbi:hypothetical protein K4S71_09765 [Staphylococcus epidermidis]|nr:hypothetical protein [Staphylococcus epidermidis]MCG1591649.1 hypothetical protein [Staphylococcus epidermidis]MCG2478640.1 hypothetical protein [Staphylococcus epidermidis]